MGTLVKCPTCKGKLSINAESCPHCGETKFFGVRRVRRQLKCDKCGGTGIYYLKHYDIAFMSGIHIVTRETLRIYRSGQNTVSTGTAPKAGEYMEFQALDDNNQLTTFAINVDNSSKLNVTLRDHIKKGTFKLNRCTKMGYANNHFFDIDYNAIKCTKCMGSKYMIVEQDERYDKREPYN